MPEIALITPAYNCGDIFHETVESVLSQSFEDWEWIIVDDGSEPEDRLILESVAAEDSRITLLHQDNKGAPTARNIGFQTSTAPWIKYLDADDLLGENLLSAQLQAARSTSDKVIFSESLILIDLPGKPERLLRTGGKELIQNDLLLSHLKDRSGYPGSFLFPRTVIEKVGPWDELLIADQDGDYIMRTGFLFPETIVVEDVFFHYRHHERTNRISVGFTEPRLESRIQVCEKIAETLEAAGRLKAPYAIPLAQRLDALARVASVDFPYLSGRALDFANKVSPNYPSRDPWFFNLCRNLLGLRRSEVIKRILRRQK